MPSLVMEGTILPSILSPIVIHRGRLFEEPFISIDGIYMINGCHKWCVIVISVGWMVHYLPLWGEGTSPCLLYHTSLG